MLCQFERSQAVARRIAMLEQYEQNRAAAETIKANAMRTNIAQASGWDRDPLKQSSDSGEAYRRFSQAEMDQVRGDMAGEMQKDLRAVHWRYGFDALRWQSEAEAGIGCGIGPGATRVPPRESKNLQVTQFKLGNANSVNTSTSRDLLRKFSSSELEAAKGATSDAVQKDLRAVHIYAPPGQNTWSSVATNIGKGTENCRRVPERPVKDQNASNIYFGNAPTGQISDSREALRQFSSQEMDDVRGSLAEEMQADLRAVHFSLGRDRGALDRHISDRPFRGPPLPTNPFATLRRIY